MAIVDRVAKLEGKDSIGPAALEFLMQLYCESY
jgi:hypothetical protein